MESIGKRIAFLRIQNCWTQQSLADRLAMSRVAISHIEMDLMIPSERSITLMAGLFKLTPSELVEGTTYPRAKAERLPELTMSYTDLELNSALLNNDLEWLGRLENPALKSRFTRLILDKWYPLLENWNNTIFDGREKQRLAEMGQKLKEINDQADHHIR